MTNVPPEIRELWTDLYKLFDYHYQMANTEEAWAEFWAEVKLLLEKHHQSKLIKDGSIMIADAIGEKMKQAYLKQYEPETGSVA